MTKRDARTDQPSQAELARAHGHRRAKAIVVGRERARAKALNEPLKEPDPIHAVWSKQQSAANERQYAAKQRTLARVAVSQAKKREYLSAARKAEDRAKVKDREAAATRQKQLDEHWAALALGETVDLHERRGHLLDTASTETQEWVRDEHGALERDDSGMPKLRTETAKARRTNKNGLERLRDKDAISSYAYETGLWYGQVCADAAIAVVSGREETGLPAARSHKSPSLATWKIDAIQEKHLADHAIRKVFVDTEGDAAVRLVEKVCFEGASAHSMSGDDPQLMARIEGRIATILAILRHHRLIRAKETAAAEQRAREIESLTS